MLREIEYRPVDIIEIMEDVFAGRIVLFLVAAHVVRSATAIGYSEYFDRYFCRGIVIRIATA